MSRSATWPRLTTRIEQEIERRMIAVRSKFRRKPLCELLEHRENRLGLPIFAAPVILLNNGSYSHVSLKVADRDHVDPVEVDLAGEETEVMDILMYPATLEYLRVASEDRLGDRPFRDAPDEVLHFLLDDVVDDDLLFERINQQRFAISEIQLRGKTAVNEAA